MIPFIDLKAQYARIEDKVRAGLDGVLDHGRYVMGPEITELEKKLAEFAGVKHCLACSSGTDALLMPLMSWGIGPGDAVFCPPFTFAATAEVVCLAGGVPVFVDVDPVTFNLDPEKLEAAIKALKAKDASIYPLPKQALKGEGLTPKAIIPVDLFGIPAEYDRIEKIAQEYGLLVLEDGAQGFGGERFGKRVCSFGNAAGTSFFPAKPLGCYGDGGAVFTDDDELVKLLDSVRVHGQGNEDKYANVRIGLNARIDSMQAAVLLAKLEIFPEELDLRAEVARKYSEGMAGIKGLVTPAVPDNCRSAWAQYSVLSDDREKVRAALGEDGVPTAVYYPTSMHLQPGYAYLGYSEGDMPVSEDLGKRIFSLPMHPYLKDDQVEHICAAVKRAVG